MYTISLTNIFDSFTFYALLVWRLEIHYIIFCTAINFPNIILICHIDIKSVSDKFESFEDNVEKDIVLYGDSRLDRIKIQSKVILEVNLTCIILKDSLESYA